MQLLDNTVQEHQNELSQILNKLSDITKRLDQDVMIQTTDDLLAAVNDPFMFVIVGEVKAGKSSFINALLNTGKEICKVAPSPMTDKIQQIVYGKEEKTEIISPYINRISQDVDILQDIAIVDTPGTNTIIDHHQELTESFIPSSDLIVFVFEAKNPYRQSAWSFFDFISSEWHKKVVFVLQQKDLLNNEDLATNIEGVRNHAMQKGITSPNIFAVSALDEIESRNDISGFKQLREYILDNITGKQARIIKLKNISTTANNIVSKLNDGIKLRSEQLSYDIEFRDDIKSGLEHQQEKSNRYIKMLAENIVASYMQIMQNRKKQLQENIGFVQLLKRSFNSIFSSEENIKNWLKEFSEGTEKELNHAFGVRLNEGIGDISESIQNMAKQVDQKIRTSKTILKDDHEIFSDIADKRSQVLNDLNNTFKGFLENAESFYPEQIDHKTKSLIPDMAKGSGLAIIGMIITGITNAAAFDITGGIITALGLSFAGITLGFNKRGIMRSYDDAVDSGKEKIHQELAGKLEQYTQNIKLKIDDNFYKFDKHLETEQGLVNAMEDDITNLSSSILTFQNKL